ncbi:Glycosyl transferases group 1 [Roseateles sp. YR242]|uniref:glycosyltransferase n=1 Tax=Roseateles sp. YR242 TaxID=1855305 RepID=UPI0008BCCD68|nr:glycosyltransferase [Roseateles sp. YR242]SEK57444.1 Glycosyl transferases group 1 [Roseateles sp. YR242]
MSKPTAAVQKSLTVGSDGADWSERPVLFISEATAFGGHESMALRAAAGLSRSGVPVGFRFWVGNERLRRAIAAENAQGASITLDDSAAADIRLGSWRTWQRGVEIAEARRFLAKDSSFARVLVQGRIDSGLVTLNAAAELGLPLISYLPMAHTLSQMGVGTLPGLRERVLRGLYKKVPAYITIDPAVERDLRARHARAPIEVAENWVPAPPTRRPLRASARARLHLPEAGPTVGTIGRIDFRQKGHDHFLRAMASPPGRERPLNWLIVGDGPDAAQLRDMISALGLSNRCHLLPWVEGGMDEVYAAVDAVVLPSNFEGVPLVMMEALARQVPVAGSDIDGMAAWLPAFAQFDRHQPLQVLEAVSQALDPAHRPAFEPAFARATAATDVRTFVARWALALQSLASAMSR